MRHDPAAMAALAITVVGLCAALLMGLADLLPGSPDELLRWAGRFDEQLRLRREELDALAPWLALLREGAAAELPTDLGAELTTPAGVLLGSGKLATELDRLDLIDEYLLVVQPRLAGHGPTLFQSGLPSTRRLELLSAKPLKCGVVAMHYRRAA